MFLIKQIMAIGWCLYNSYYSSQIIIKLSPDSTKSKDNFKNHNGIRNLNRHTKPSKKMIKCFPNLGKLFIS